MKAIKAVTTLWELDRKGQRFFSVTDLRTIFPERSENTFSDGLRRLAAQDVLRRAASM